MLPPTRALTSLCWLLPHLPWTVRPDSGGLTTTLQISDTSTGSFYSASSTLQCFLVPSIEGFQVSRAEILMNVHRSHV